MKCRIHLQCLIVGLAVFLTSGCAFSRGNQVSRSSEPTQKMSDEAADGEAPIQTASADGTGADNSDAPPSQPGVKPSGGAKSRSKLTGWLTKGTTKSGAIPLDRTDKSKSADESVEEDSGWWKHQDAPATAKRTQSESTKDPEALSLSSSNPFDR
ncbi:MAG: hypothetical protein V4719_08975 [Planctomycetota bacterium]